MKEITMPKYRSKPVEKEAFHYGIHVAPDWFRDAIKIGVITLSPQEHFGNPVAIIKTWEGNMRAQAGDYIIKGLNGEIYPCKAEIFEKSYEEVD